MPTFLRKVQLLLHIKHHYLKYVLYVFCGWIIENITREVRIWALCLTINKNNIILLLDIWFWIFWKIWKYFCLVLFARCGLFLFFIFLVFYSLSCLARAFYHFTTNHEQIFTTSMKQSPVNAHINNTQICVQNSSQSCYHCTSPDVLV